MHPNTKYAVIPFVIGAVALGVWLTTDSLQVFAVCFATLVFAVPVCLMMLWEWLRTGVPPDISLSPLIPGRAEREFWRNLETRPKMSDDAFYVAFYKDSPISQTTTNQLREILTDEIGMDLSTLYPHDDLNLIDFELDWVPILRRIEQAFCIKFSKTQVSNGPATFDRLVNLISAAVDASQRVG